jgi:hypothetical protein
MTESEVQIHNRKRVPEKVIWLRCLLPYGLQISLSPLTKPSHLLLYPPVTSQPHPQPLSRSFGPSDHFHKPIRYLVPLTIKTTTILASFKMKVTTILGLVVAGFAALTFGERAEIPTALSFLLTVSAATTFDDGTNEKLVAALAGKLSRFDPWPRSIALD